MGTERSVNNARVARDAAAAPRSGRWLWRGPMAGCPTVALLLYTARGCGARLPHFSFSLSETQFNYKSFIKINIKKYIVGAKLAPLYTYMLHDFLINLGPWTACCFLHYLFSVLRAICLICLYVCICMYVYNPHSSNHKGKHLCYYVGGLPAHLPAR